MGVILKMEIGFKGLHPVSAFLFFAFSFSVAFCFSHPLLIVTSLLCALLYDIKLRGKTGAKSFFLFVLPLVILITAFNFLISHYGVTTLYEFQSVNRLTLEALVYGLVFALKASAVLLWLNCFNEIITADKFIFLFGKFSPRTALVISMVLRFLPLLRSQAKEIETARKGLGIDSKTGKFSKRLTNSIHTISILITWVLESAIDTSNSMSARGYGLKNRSAFHDFIFTFHDAAFSVSAVFTLAVLVIFRKSFYATYNPIIKITTPSAMGFIVYAVFFVLSILPFIYDLWEEKLWSTSKFKI